MSMIFQIKSQIGCQIDNVCVNHVMYADDICLMAPSPAALQKLINICYDVGLRNNLTFNSSKSFCMVFKPRLYKLSCPTFYMNNEKLDYTDSIKYLGFTFSSDKKDVNDMLRQMRILYTKSNRLLRLFHCCSTDVKLTLFRSYCTCFYSPFLWTHYKKSTHSKLRVAFNNVYRLAVKTCSPPPGPEPGSSDCRSGALPCNLKYGIHGLNCYISNTLYFFTYSMLNII